MTWALLETGFTFSRYAVKSLSRQSISVCDELGEKESGGGESPKVFAADVTIPHSGQPGFGAKEDMLYSKICCCALRLHCARDCLTMASIATLQAFEAFRVELDDYNDRRERLIKVLP